MTQEEKQLLLIDLCARLPYGVVAYASEINKNGIITDVNIPYNMVNLTVDNSSGKYELVPLFDIKPYFRPMSSMTEGEKEEYGKVCELDTEILSKHPMDGTPFPALYNSQDWLNKHHFDYRGLIEMDLAIKAPEEMYKN